MLILRVASCEHGTREPRVDDGLSAQSHVWFLFATVVDLAFLVFPTYGRDSVSLFWSRNQSPK